MNIQEEEYWPAGQRPKGIGNGKHEAPQARHPGDASRAASFPGHKKRAPGGALDHRFFARSSSLRTR